MSVRGPGRPLYGQLYITRASFTKILAVGLERARQLRALVAFAGYSGSIPPNSSSREDSPLLTSLDARHLNDAHTYKQVKHSTHNEGLNEKHLPESRAFECLVPN